MKVKTGLRAGTTVQQVVENARETVADAARQAVDTAQDAGRGISQWWENSGAGNLVSRAFWFPLEPPK